MVLFFLLSSHSILTVWFVILSNHFSSFEKGKGTLYDKEALQNSSLLFSCQKICNMSFGITALHIKPMIVKPLAVALGLWMFSKVCYL